MARQFRSAVPASDGQILLGAVVLVTALALLAPVMACHHWISVWAAAPCAVVSAATAATDDNRIRDMPVPPKEGRPRYRRAATAL